MFFLHYRRMAASVFPLRTGKPVGSESSGYRARAAWPLEPETGFAFLPKPLMPTWQLTASSLFSKPSRPAAWEDTVNKARLPKTWQKQNKAWQGRGQRRGLTLTLCRTWYMFLVRMSRMDSTSSGESRLVPCILSGLETPLEKRKAIIFLLGQGVPWGYNGLCPVLSWRNP